MTGIDLCEASPVVRKLTDEQEAILRQQPDQNVIVEAAAGAGKTSTLVEYANKYRGHKGLYIVFSADAAKEANNRLPPHVRARTAHSYAHRALGVSRFSDRLRQRLRRNDIRLAGIDLKSDYLPPDRLMRAILNGLTNFCNDAGTQLLPRHCGLEKAPAMVQSRSLPQIAAVVKRFLDYENSGLPFTHDMYLKKLEMHGTIGDVADYLLLDEAQDLNPVLISLVQKSKKPAIIVGDPKQSIYAFRGAVNAFDSFDGPRFPLSQSWRYGPEVAAIANYIFSFSEKPMAHPVRGHPDRETKIEVYGGQVPARAFVLARTNARLFEGLVKVQVPFFVAGGFDTLAKQLLSAWALSQNDQFNVTDSYVRSFAQWEDLCDEAEEDDPDAKRLVRMVAEYGSQIPAIIERLRSLQRPHPQDAHILLSTAHKAKGLEADTVVICDDFETPAEMYAKLTDEQIGRVAFEQELNLLYVALSRPRYRLILPASLYGAAMTALAAHLKN